MTAPTLSFDPDKGFDSPAEALTLILKEADPEEALILVVAANIRLGEYGFASELVRDFPDFVD